MILVLEQGHIHLKMFFRRTGIHRPLRYLILQRGITGQSLSNTHSRKASNVLEPDTILIRKMESYRIIA